MPAPAANHTTLADPNSIPVYRCAACCQEQPIPKTGELLCHFCSHQTGSSKVFFKVRSEKTTYDTR